MKDSLCELVDFYIDGSLEPVEENAFEQHLSECDPCRDAVQGFCEMDLLVRQHAQRIVSDESIVVLVHGNKPARRAIFITSVVAAIAATILVVIAVRQQSKSKPFTPLPGSLETASRRDALAVDPTHESSDGKDSPKASRLTITSVTHLAVVDANEDEPFTFVMMYPKLVPSSKSAHSSESFDDPSPPSVGLP